MKMQILKFLTEHGTLIQPSALEYVLAQKKPLEYIKKILACGIEYPLILGLEDLKLLESKLAKDFTKGDFQPLEQAVKAEPPEQVQEIELIKDLTGKSTSTGELNDFSKYFNSRYDQLRKLLKSRRELFGTSSIAQFRKTDAQLKLIGIVNEVRITRRGHKIIELEDDTGAATALIPSSSALVSEPIIQDEVVGIVGKFSSKNNLFITEDVIRPGFQLTKNVRRSSEAIYAVFISDLHVGSKTFLHNEWSNFVTWLESNNGIAGKVKYIVISGDCVDGVGVYPGQEKDLELKDLFMQYEKLARKLSNIPSQIKIILLPGNHDGVRQAEPQPALPESIRKLFSEQVTFVSNPCYFALHGVEILAYHGRSFDDFVTVLPGASYTKPILIMKEMLKRRHLAIVYGGRTPLAPEHSDWLVIDKIPDIFVTGHVHSSQVALWKDILLINASTWQSQTGYQAMQGFVPEPARAVLVNLKTLKPKILDFSE